MLTKRHYGDGSIKEARPGVWYLRWRDGATQRRRTYRGTQEQALRELRRLTSTTDQLGASSRDPRLTLGDWLEDWVSERKGDCKPATLKNYAHSALVLSDALGRVKLVDLTYDRVTDVVSDWRSDGLTEVRIRAHLKVLRMALKRAVMLGKVASNAAALVTLPNPDRAALNVPDPETADALLDRVRGDALEPAYLLALGTGVRQGELLALRWSDVDLDECRVRVNRQRSSLTKAETSTKSGKGRTVALAPWAAERLRELAQGRPSDRVVSTAERPDEQLRNHLHATLAAMSLEPFRWHDLRHAFAYRVMLRGGALERLSKQLGHSSITITADYYGHLSSDALSAHELRR